MEKDSCIFCKIVKGKIKSEKVLEDENYLAFRDIEPKKNIHVLVIPKEHIEDFEQISGELMGMMTQFIHKVTEKENISEYGYTIKIHVKENGGQEIDHLHIHLLSNLKTTKN